MYVSIYNAAMLLDISPQQLRKLNKQGILMPAAYDGHKSRYSLEQLRNAVIQKYPILKYDHDGNSLEDPTKTIHDILMYGDPKIYWNNNPKVKIF